MCASKIAKRWAIGTNQSNGYVDDIDSYIFDSQGESLAYMQDFYEEFGGNLSQLMERPYVWSCIETLAEKLLEKKELSGDEVDVIVADQWRKLDGDNQEEARYKEDVRFGWGHYKRTKNR